MAGQLKRILGVDLTAIPGLHVLAVLTLLSEIGTHMAKWRHEKAFASWLGLCPNNKVSGQRVLSSRTRRVNNRAASILRLAALAVGKTDTPLGACELATTVSVVKRCRSAGCSFCPCCHCRERHG